MWSPWTSNEEINIAHPTQLKHEDAIEELRELLEARGLHLYVKLFYKGVMDRRGEICVARGRGPAGERGVEEEDDENTLCEKEEERLSESSGV